MRLRAVAIILGIAVYGMPEPLRACNVPVFRYAMERWAADPYQVVIYHRGQEQAEAWARLREPGHANLSLQDVDVSTPEGKALAGRRGIAGSPWVEVYYPLNSRIRKAVWSGPLSAARAGSILHSPLRAQLARRLLDGEVAVWILVKSGQAEKDSRALETLRRELDRASATLRVPETGIDADGNLIEVTDFKTYPVRFGLMEVARDDPEERLLVNALLASEPDLRHYDEPIAFPVFGRGRVLYALVGKGIKEKTIWDACNSMLAWCSCEIKALNPGTDLLIAADWSRPAGGKMVKDPEVPLTGVSAFLEPEREPAEQPAEAPVAACRRLPAEPAPVKAPAPVPADSPLLRNVLYLAGGAGVALAALSLFLTVRAKR